MTECAVLADALWRATVYAAVCRLHLRDNVLLNRPLAAEDVKDRPSGHWGTVPGTAWALSTSRSPLDSSTGDWISCLSSAPVTRASSSSPRPG